jgi:hypothetical protein
MVMGLDPLERKFSLGGAAASLLLTIVYLSQLGKTITKPVTVKPISANVCPKSFHLIGKLCHGVQTTQKSGLILLIIVMVVMGTALAFFAYRRNRPGAIVAALLLGFLGGTAGILFMFLGGWLAVRAFRLQRYGDPTFSGSNIKAREMAQQRRANRGTRTKTSRTSKSSSSTAVANTPAPSKRYTPKKTNRR